MTIINLKEMYSNYYIRQWKKEGLRLITQRPPTTTQEILDNFFMNRSNKVRYKINAIKNERARARIKKLDWKDYLREEYK